MKKLHSLAITVASVLLMGSLAAGVSAASDAAMNAVYGTPKVDGAIDEIWATAECQDVILVDKAVIPSDSKTTGKFRTMWDENYFYVLVEVDKAGAPVCVDGSNENTADCADVCITIDGNFNATLTAGGDVYAGVMRVTADGTQSGFGYMFDMFEDEYLGVMKTTSDSTYVVEYGIPWDDITPKAGHVLSMDIQINDATAGARTGLVTWASTPCYCWQSSAEHGTITLVEAASAEPAVEEVADTDAAMNAVYGTPKVDGAIDEIWATAECQDVTLVDKAVIPSDSKTTGKFRTMWDENYFYVLVEVDKAGAPVCIDGSNENTADCADVCITIDGNFNATLTAGGDVYAGVMRVTADGTQSGFGYMFEMFEGEYLGVMKTTSDSTYVVEYGIPWDDIKPEVGHVLSMDIQINDATDDARTGLVTWASTPCYCWQSSAEHGAITLVEAVVETPVVEEVVVETPVVEEVVVETPVVEAPQTFDLGIIAAVSAAVSLAGYAFSKKR